MRELGVKLMGAGDFGSLGWSENPFTFNIMPELFVGYNNEVDAILHSVNLGDKFSLLLGPTGSGKTTMLMMLMTKFHNYEHVLYIPKPPKNPADWVSVFDRFVKVGFPRSLFSRGNGTTLYTLSETLNTKLGGSKCILFVDEAHEASIESLEWLRTITDQTDGLSIVLAGLPVFDGMLKSQLETFLKRVNTRVELSTLTKSETRELIKKRIESKGGEDIKPFTIDSVDYIYEKTGGFPREIIRSCGESVLGAMKKNITTIDIGFLRETERPEERVSLEALSDLPERQRAVLETLAEKGELTPSEVIRHAAIEGYKDSDNAVRSINNLLKRLMKEKLVERAKRGKTYKYRVSGKYQSLTVKA
jgi:type II secretory pathway predicted ATPase ExeA